MLNIKKAIKKNPGADSFVKALFGGHISVISMTKLHEDKYALLYSKDGLSWTNSKYTHTNKLYFNKEEMDIFNFFLKKKNMKSYTEINQVKFFAAKNSQYLTKKEYENYEN